MGMRRRRTALARRYGHFSLDGGLARVRGFIADNPEVTAAAIGGTVGTIFAGIPQGAAAIVGATTGVLGQKLVKHCRQATEDLVALEDEMEGVE
jgi:hypothetical protein